MEQTLPRYSGPERRITGRFHRGVERRVAASGSALPNAIGTESRTRFMGHPVHQQLVFWPLGLLAAAVAFDIGHLVFDSATSAQVSTWLIAAGLVGAVVAAPFGTLDWKAIPSDTRAKAVGAMHGAGNVAVVVLFAASWWLRRDVPDAPPTTALLLSIVGGLVAVLTAWLGGELVSRLGIGVSRDAGPDASNSMRERTR